MMGTVGLRSFWDSLDTNQLRNVLFVHKQEMIQELIDERDKYLFVASMTAIEEELQKRATSKPLRPEPLFITLSSEGIYNLSSSAISRSLSRNITYAEFAQCNQDGEFLVSRDALDALVRTLDPGYRAPPLNFCHDKICLKCVDMLTYPRPIRKFKLIVEKRLPFSDIRGLLAADIGIDDVDSMVIRVKGKEVAREESRSLDELGLKDNQQIVISRKLGTGVEGPAQSVEQNKQFVGDLLFGQKLGDDPSANNVAKLFNITQGHQLLAKILERYAVENLLDSYFEDRRARLHELELIALLAMEAKQKEEEDEKRRKKKQKKKDKEKRKKEQSTRSDTSGPPVAVVQTQTSNDAVKLPDSLSSSSKSKSQACELEPKSLQPASQDHLSSDICIAEAQTNNPCHGCGCELESSYRFCWNCGQPVNQTTRAESEVVAHVDTVTTAVPRRRERKRRNKSSASTLATDSSANVLAVDDTHAKLKPVHPASMAKSSRLEETTTTIPSYDTLNTMHSIVNHDRRSGRSDSHDSSIEGFLAAETLPQGHLTEDSATK